MAVLGLRLNRSLALFFGVSLAWGIPYFLIKICLEELSPVVLVWARTTLGALVLLPWVIAQGWLKPVFRRWRWLLIFTVIEVSIPWYLISRAEQQLTSSVTGLLIAAVPIVGVAVAKISGRPQPMGMRGWLGLLVALAGVAAIVGLDLRGNQWSAVLDMAIVVVCYAVGSVLLARWFGDQPASAVIAAALLLAAVGYTPFIGSSWPQQPPSGQTLAALAALAVICTAGGFVMFAALIGRVGPVRATTVTAINPAVAVLAGALFLGEPIGPWTGLGFVLVVGGSVAVNSRPRPDPQLRPESLHRAELG